MISLRNRPHSEATQLPSLHLLKWKAAYRLIIVTFPFFSCCVSMHDHPTLTEPRSHTATTHPAERIATLLFTYIIGDIYLHFWSFQIRHHLTCYTVSLSLNCHFFMQVLFSPACQVFKQGTVGDAHTTHTCIHAA